MSPHKENYINAIEEVLRSNKGKQEIAKTADFAFLM
jgi:hypothetical protein